MILIGVCLALIIGIGIYEPVFIENKKENWGDELNQQVEIIERGVQQTFQKYQEAILNELSDVKSNLKSEFAENPNNFPTGKLLTNISEPDKYFFIIRDNDNQLLAWSYNSGLTVQPTASDYYRPGQTYFTSSTLIEHLSVFDTLKTGIGELTLVLFQPIEKNYIIENRFYTPQSLSQQLSNKYEVDFEINHSRNAGLTRDGRKHSIEILNNNNNKIGVVTFNKPMREIALQEATEYFKFIQSSLAFIVLLLIGFLIAKFINGFKRRSVRFFVLLFYLIALRYVIHYLNFSAYFEGLEITNSKYFSSLFGGGIVSSPLDLFITLSILFIAIILLLKYVKSYFSENSGKENRIRFIFSIIIFVPLYFLSIRALGASLKSIIFDSSLRYYKDESLFPGSIEVFMLFNVLLLGIIIFIGTLSFLIILYKNLPARINKIKAFFSLFVMLQAIGIIFDLVQNEPQTTPLFRIIFVLLSFIALYLIVSEGRVKVLHFFGYAFVSSVMVILLLGQYNSLIEKESLRKSAYNITRQNAELLRFAVYETLVEAITDRETVKSFTSKNINADAIAFKFWSNSVLQKEALGSSINILDRDHNSIGSFNFRFNRDLEINWDKYSSELSDLEEIKIFEESIVYSDNKIIRGIATIEDVEGVLGYITVNVLYDLTSLSIPSAPEFLSSDAGFINDTIEFTKLKIFDFHNGTLINSLSNYNLSEKEIISILDAKLNKFGESWINLSINNENHLVFILKRDQNNINRVLAIALKEKELSWGLFDFFKIFFVHLLIIVSVFLVYLLFKLYKTPKVKYTFATKLLISFILISLIPLILISIFFRTLTTDKNEYAIEYKLGKRAVSVDEYLDTYLTETSAGLKAVSEKASRDLGVDFTLYQNKDYVYSTNNQYYAVGLIPTILNPVAYNNLFTEGLNEIVVKENIESYRFNALYYKTSLLGDYYVIKITDAFNKIMLPLEGEEVDVYIFVSYSIGLVIILILGFILTNQISKPISKLKNATRSVASGDLDIEVNVKTRDEVSELVDGFNYMVKELKRSQSELAEFERETAWKEMAKQVAHEIKNPLTPMKLSVQQLIAAYKDKSPKFDELFNKVSGTVINQIETLRNIATEFSAFARMPNPKIEKVNLNNLLKEATDLFSDEKAVIEIEQSEQIELNIDKDQLRRVFINLIRNSIQADSKKIRIKIFQENNMVLISISDNGTGVPEDIVHKVFDAEFSTKQKGMGLGLSMAKKTIENYNGEIFIERTSNQGTTILIKLPIA